MTDVSNEFISQQLERVLTRLGAMKDQTNVLTNMVMRLDDAVTGLAMELRGAVQAILRKLEDAEHAR